MKTMRKLSALSLFAASLATWAFMLDGCGSDDSSGSGQLAGVGAAGTGTATVNGGGGQGGGLFNTGGTGGGGGTEPCAQSSADATLVNKPVDIIFVIDNSGSMSAEIAEVERQINANFATIIDAAMPPVDYRVIMVSGFGSYVSRLICVAAPLGGIPDMNMDGHCDMIPAAPVNTTKFFHHSRVIGSHDALCRFIEQFSAADPYGLQPMGFQGVLRPEAFKFVSVITDDGVSCSFNLQTYFDGDNVMQGDAVALQWDAAIQALSPTHFGPNAMNRNYSFWSIIAQAPYMPTMTDPYGQPAPGDAVLAPITTALCTPSAVDPGTGYQGLSILTGGYRFPTCGLDYTDIFTLMAQGVIAGSQVPCAFDIPPPPPNQMLDLSTVQVAYSSMGNPVATFDQVANLAACTATSFYIDLTLNQIILCPGACTTVQSDPNAEIDILYGCDLGGIE